MSLRNRPELLKEGTEVKVANICLFKAVVVSSIVKRSLTLLYLETRKFIAKKIGIESSSGI